MARIETDEDRVLDALFAEARQTPPDPSAALLARVLAEAEAVQADFAAAAPSRPRVAAARGDRAWHGILDLLGGWGGVGGLVAAGLTGLWIGFSGTGLLGDASAGIWGATAADAATEFGAGEVFSFTLALEGEA